MLFHVSTDGLELMYRALTFFLSLSLSHAHAHTYFYFLGIFSLLETASKLDIWLNYVAMQILLFALKEKESIYLIDVALLLLLAYIN